MNFVYLNGELVQPSVFDPGLLAGHGLFETIRVQAGKPLALRYHFERFANTAPRLGLEVPPETELTKAIDQMLSGNKVADARLRITLTGVNGERPTLWLTTTPLPDYKPTAKVMTVPWTRNENSALAGIKSLSYGENIAALNYAKEHGADEAVFTNTKGHLCEGATTNLFIMSGDKVLTPPLSSGCLPGTARRKVLELSGIPSIEKDLTMPVDNIEFAFLTSSLRRVQPICQIDDQVIPTSHPLLEKIICSFPAD